MSCQVLRSIIHLAVASYAAFMGPLDTFDRSVAETMELFDKGLSSFFDFGRVTSTFRLVVNPFSSRYEVFNTLLSPLLQRVRYYAPPSLINSVDMAVKAWRLVIPINGTARASSAMSSVDASARQIMQLVATDPLYAIAFGWSIILFGVFVYSKATRLRSAALILKLVKVYPPLKEPSHSLTWPLGCRVDFDRDCNPATHYRRTRGCDDSSTFRRCYHRYTYRGLVRGTVYQGFPILAHRQHRPDPIHSNT
jgi:hypothetical protein